MNAVLEKISCCSLRTRCFIYGIITTFLGFVTFLNGCFTSTEEPKEFVEPMRNTQLTMGIITFGKGVLLIYGERKNNHHCILAWLAIDALSVVPFTLLALFFTIIYPPFVILFLVCLWFWLEWYYIYRFYKELSSYGVRAPPDAPPMAPPEYNPESY